MLLDSFCGMRWGLVWVWLHYHCFLLLLVVLEGDMQGGRDEEYILHLRSSSLKYSNFMQRCMHLLSYEVGLESNFKLSSYSLS